MILCHISPQPRQDEERGGLSSQTLSLYTHQLRRKPTSCPQNVFALCSPPSFHCSSAFTKHSLEKILFFQQCRHPDNRSPKLLPSLHLRRWPSPSFSAARISRVGHVSFRVSARTCSKVYKLGLEISFCLIANLCSRSQTRSPSPPKRNLHEGL